MSLQQRIARAIAPTLWTGNSFPGDQGDTQLAQHRRLMIAAADRVIAALDVFEHAPWRGWGSLLHKLALIVFLYTGVVFSALYVTSPDLPLRPLGLTFWIGNGLLALSLLLDFIGKRRGEPKIRLRSVIVE